ncbi:hypothetical protein DAPPUDRAFT_266524 [Daphnia pulex]|uniref:Uncharacterized protein n=1 Tax=Daphnia pulex TaxID=6669 RepID=E9HV56_DAPPU|nr:hypothetical protein DAPPUDRAFT_266524 [Daphnia pulex]|eukprot:EFX64376.1 hypothetical protein DAPPUDRAFT_266524 [Daphnia pulex]
MPKVEMEETSTPGQATEKQIGPQASATQADPAVSSTTGLQKSSALSSIGSRFPVTPTDDHNYKRLPSDDRERPDHAPVPAECAKCGADWQLTATAGALAHFSVSGAGG